MSPAWFFSVFIYSKQDLLCWIKDTIITFALNKPCHFRICIHGLTPPVVEPSLEFRKKFIEGFVVYIFLSLVCPNKFVHKIQTNG